MAFGADRQDEGESLYVCILMGQVHYTDMQLSFLAYFLSHSLVSSTVLRQSGYHSLTPSNRQCICRFGGSPTSARHSTISSSSEFPPATHCAVPSEPRADISLCYFVNILDLVWLWIFPQSTSLFIASYLLTMGQSCL